ncbi:hypothetical protein GMMP13_1670001 [Candidatus Magnetomoraceae bacterium gMMP-13]
MCDGQDNDCDGQTDEGVTNTYYRDSDGDGYGNLNSTKQDCSPPSGYVSDKTDCNDNDRNIYPGATETCNNKDDNCNNQVDEGGICAYSWKPDNIDVGWGTCNSNCEQTRLVWCERSDGTKVSDSNCSGSKPDTEQPCTGGDCVTPTKIIRLTGNLDFGNVEVNNTATRTLTIWNDGNATLNVDSISYPNGFSGNWNGGDINSGGNKEITITFSPTSETNYSGMVNVSSDKTSGTNTISISGTGASEPSPILSVTPAFQSVPATSGTTEFNVTNSGTGTMNWTATENENYTWLEIISGSSGVNDGTITVSYEANTGGQRTGLITITPNGTAYSSKTVEIRQTGNDSPLKLSDEQGIPGSNISIPITLDNSTNTNIEGINISIMFNTNVLNITGATLTGGILENENYSLQVNTSVSGQVTLAISANANLFTGNGIIAYLQFEVVGNVGQITNLTFANAEINESSVNTDNGLFTVTSPMTLSLSDQTSSPGTNISMPIILDNPTNVDIEGVNITISFNASVVNVTDAVLTGGVLENENYSLQINTSVSGQVTLAISANANLFTGDGIIAYVQFEVIGNVDDTSELIFSQALINEYPVNIDNGLVSITAYMISGRVSYFHNSKIVDNVKLNLEGTTPYSTTTNEQGYYTFTDVAPGSYTLRPSKNDDLGGLSATDSSRISRHSVDLYNFNCYQKITADVSENGTISATDSSRVSRYSINLISNLNSSSKHWRFTPAIANCDGWPPINYQNHIEYSSLNSNQENQDFLAIRLGDVTGNWVPDTGARSQRLPRSDILPECKLTASGTFQIPIALTGTSQYTPIEGLDITVNFDKDKLEANSATLSGGILENKNYSLNSSINNDNGLIGLAISANGDLITSGGKIAFIEFNFKVSEPINTKVSFTQFDLNESEVTLGRDGGFDVDDTTCEEMAALVVELISFTATACQNHIVLEWETATEIDTLGFHILRSDSIGGEYTRINKQIIPSTGFAASGDHYFYIDNNVLPGKTYYYQLEDIDNTSHFSDPVASEEWRPELEDIIFMIKILSGFSDSEHNISKCADINTNNTIDLGDVIYMLQHISVTGQ